MAPQILGHRAGPAQPVRAPRPLRLAAPAAHRHHRPGWRSSSSWRRTTATRRSMGPASSSPVRSRRSTHCKRSSPRFVIKVGRCLRAWTGAPQRQRNGPNWKPCSPKAKRLERGSISHAVTSMSAALEQLTAGMDGPNNGGHRNGKSLGWQYANHPSIRDFIRAGGHRSSGSWTTPAVELHATTLAEERGAAGRW